jgi:hypothetical protein
VVVPGKDQVDARPLEIAVEQKLCVRDNDRIRRRVGGVSRNRLDMRVPVGVQARAIGGKLGVEFACLIQKGHRKWLIYNLNDLNLHIIGISIAKPSPACASPPQLDPEEPLPAIFSVEISNT